LTYEAICRGVDQILENGHRPTVLLVSLEQYQYALDTDTEFRKRIRPGINRLVIDDSLELDILTRLPTTEYALILDPASGRWSEIDPIRPAVSVCPKDALQVHLEAKVTVQYHLINLHGVAILRFSQAIPLLSGDEILG
jgi:hypothetical protein